MLPFLATLSIVMMVICHLLLNRSFKKAYKNIILAYFYIFSCCAIAVSGLLFYQSRERWIAPLTEWVDQQKGHIYALASETEEPPAKTDAPETKENSLKEEVQINVDLIAQYPELPRGCEVTSLAMLLQYHGIDVGKMELAEKVKKDPTPFRQTEKGIYFGNPEKGFVGDMYSLDNPGFGVYHKPIAELASQYTGERVNDFSGGTFDEAIQHLSEGKPVWVIINTTYKKLPKEQFTTWQTPDGEISITRKEHAVVLTGYDEKHIYFNDPLNNEKRKAPLDSFEKAWVQMGKQAITIEQS